MASNGRVIYTGPSQLDQRTPIVCILTGLRSPSTNKKTGPMVQSWILLQDLHPSSAAWKVPGADRAICGDCIHRTQEYEPGSKTRTCYVQVEQAPAGVWKSWRAGKYPEFNTLGERDLLKGKLLRIGSYGDPRAVPADTWRLYLSMVAGTTGYTHMWKDKPKLRAAVWSPFLMASVETLEEATLAKKHGWRYFRVRPVGGPIWPNEVQCPAVRPDKINATTCSQCMLCNGSDGRPDVSIEAHGTHRLKFQIPEVENETGPQTP